MSARGYTKMTNDQKAAVRAAFAQTPLGAPYTDRIVAAFKSAGVPIRNPDSRGKYFPSFFPWLKTKRSALSTQQSAGGGKRQKHSALSTQQSAKAESRPLTAESSFSAAVRALADSLVQFVLAEVTFSLQSSVVSLQPSVASLQGGKHSALSTQHSAKAESRPLTAESSLHSLSDQQLRDRLGVAKAANNLGLCAKITNVLRMRDRSATVIANTHQEES